MKSEIHNSKFDIIIEVLLILLLIFTPIAFASQVLWAFSLMELGILLIIIIGAVKVISHQFSANISKSQIRNPKSEIKLSYPPSLPFPRHCPSPDGSPAGRIRKAHLAQDV